MAAAAAKAGMAKASAACMLPAKAISGGRNERRRRKSSVINQWRLALNQLERKQ